MLQEWYKFVKIVTCTRLNAYFLFLNTILKTRHTMANTIPTVAEMSKITTKATLNVLVTFVGVPSGGTPSEIHNRQDLVFLLT